MTRTSRSGFVATPELSMLPEPKKSLLIRLPVPTRIECEDTHRHVSNDSRRVGYLNAITPRTYEDSYDQNADTNATANGSSHLRGHTFSPNFSLPRCRTTFSAQREAYDSSDPSGGSPARHYDYATIDDFKITEDATSHAMDLQSATPLLEPDCQTIARTILHSKQPKLAAVSTSTAPTNPRSKTPSQNLADVGSESPNVSFSSLAQYRALSNRDDCLGNDIERLSNDMEDINSHYEYKRNRMCRYIDKELPKLYKAERRKAMLEIEARQDEDVRMQKAAYSRLKKEHQETMQSRQGQLQARIQERADIKLQMDNFTRAQLLNDLREECRAKKRKRADV